MKIAAAQRPIQSGERKDMVAHRQTGPDGSQVLKINGTCWGIAAGGLVADIAGRICESDWGAGAVGGVLAGQFHAVQIGDKTIIVIDSDPQMLAGIERCSDCESFAN